MINAKQFARLIRRERTQQGLSQIELQKRTGITHANISRLECNLYKNGPTLETCCQLLDALGLEFKIVRKATKDDGAGL